MDVSAWHPSQYIGKKTIVRNIKLGVLWIAPLLFLILFYIFPIYRILAVSYARAEAGWLASLWDVATSPVQWRIIGFTFWQAALSTLLTLLIGLPGAYIFAHYDFRGKSLLQAMMGIPFVMPTLVVAAAFNALLGPRGWVNLALMDWFNLKQAPIEFTNTLFAILLAHIFYNLTIVIRMVGDFWSHVDPRLNQAAEVLGANRWRALRHVTLPLLLPAITAAAVLIFIFDFTSFGVILVLGGPQFATLETEIYYQTVSLFNLPLAASLAVIQLICTLLLTAIYSRLSARLSQPLSLKPRQLTQRRLTRWRSRLAVGLVVSFLLALELIPLIALAARSFTSMEIEGREGSQISRQFTLVFYQELGINRRESLFYVPPAQAVANSLTFAAATVFLALCLGLPVSWALAHEPEAWSSRVMDPVLMLPLGTSAVTLGLGFIVALNMPPLDLRASPVLIPLAHTLVAFPFVVRSLTPAMRSIRPRLHHAAAVLGAPSMKVFRHIDLPLVARALLVAATFAFTISLGEFGATAILARPEYPTIPVVIYRLISQPGALNYGQALALSTILMVTCAAGILAIERFRLADVGEF
jgi:thiamine transport system permease protein